MSLSEAVKQAYTRAKTFHRHFLCVELGHSLFPNQAFRFVDYDRDVTVGGQVYTPQGMEVREPPFGTEPDADMVVKMDGSPWQLQYWLAAANTRDEPIKATCIPIIYDTVRAEVFSTVRTYNFEVRAVQYSNTDITFNLGRLSPANVPFPGVYFNISTHPFLFV